MNINLRGGKTAPRLLQDLLQYDPRQIPTSGFNILTDVLFHDEGGYDLAPPLPPVGRGSCRHQWSIKRNQSVIPPDKDYRPSPTASWQFATYCSLCRSHLGLSIKFSEGSAGFAPCPTNDRPLHHFVYRPDLSRSRQQCANGVQTDSGFAWVDMQQFHCTSPQCCARLAIRFMPPRLSPDWVSQLTNKFVIKARAEKVMKEEPSRYEGIAVPLPVIVLEHLSLYISNALHDSGSRKKIPGNNKKFSTSLGDSCAKLLEYLGFAKEGDDWIPPRPDPNEDIPFRDSSRILLDDVQKEIHVLISKEPSDQIRSAKITYHPELASSEMKAALGCKEYQKSLISRNVDLTVDEHPFYAGLGAISDFHDDLVSFAYDRQISCDRKNVPYYLECLQVIADGRGSEVLQTKAAIEASENKVSLKDIRVAYQNFGLDIRDPYLADETIIGTFQARVSDAPMHEAEMRRDLKMIGQNRASERIQTVASQAVTTYEQALLFLGASDDTADEFVPSMFSVKVGDKPSDENIARHAVALIANHRKSNALKSWLDTGALGEVEMDVAQAYARLDISDRTIDDDMILASYEISVTEQPSQADDLNRALTAIAKSRHSAKLQERLGIDADYSKRLLSDWPVGIENIGNTCYLNSLLQFYFTIKPLREMVLEIDKFKMPVDEESLKSKRVGSRNVSKKEVDRAQRFVDELQKLFRELITSSKASFKPNPDVARLTLLSSSKAEQARRQSMLSSERPSFGQSLGEINGMAISGPAVAPPAQAIQEDTEMIDSAGAHAASTWPGGHDHDSDNSSDTLVDGAIVAHDSMVLDSKERIEQQTMLENKENLPPSQGPPLAAELTPLNESSPSRINEQQAQSPVKGESSLVDLTSENSDAPHAKQLSHTPANSGAPPDRPPPFPPRPQPQQTDSDAIKEAEYGAQQDVGEVIANVLFQLQCAIKPESIDESGEQLDQVKSLFYGKQKSYTTNKQGTIRTKEEYMSDIKVDVASGPRDIYAALDGAYDVQDVEVGGGIEPQYSSISQLPPVLMVLIQRAQFDPRTKTTFKSDNHLELKETIFLDRYMDSTDPDLIQRRQESWNWKRQLHVLEKRWAQLATSDLMGMNASEILEATHGYVRQIADINDGDPIEVPQLLIQQIESAAREARQELEALDKTIKDLRSSISSQFNDLRSIPYRLASVFIHVGSHITGHYWIYIYDFKAKIWRKYNDEKITEVKDTKEIFEANKAPRPPTPYYLVYVKDEPKESLVDPVCRDIKEPPQKETQDVDMEDYTDIPITSETVADPYRSINQGSETTATDPLWAAGANWDSQEARNMPRHLW